VVEAARRVAQGHLEERLPVNRHDEIGELNRSFNEMVDGLRQKVDLEGRLHRAERMSAIAHLASGIAHEVRNPLSTISMTIGHLAARHAPQEPAAREEFQRLTSMMMGEIGRLNQMIESFLRYGKPLRLTRRPSALPGLLEEVLEMAAPRAAAQQVRVDWSVDGPLPEVWVDPVHLKTCFVNLVLNALQAMPGGGALTVTACAVAGTGDRGSGTGDRGPGAGVSPQPSPADPPPPSGAAWVAVRVADTGVGIPEESLGSIFEPYFTTKEVGIGLGLALTKQIIEEHGGEIRLTSAVGRGTEAVVRLPVGVPSP
jgi:signal transduction histidine kinase